MSDQTKHILCVYATRQIDSNLFMASTIFNGLKQAGYRVDIVFMGYREVIDVFKERYGHYFHEIYEVVIKKGWIVRHLKSDRSKLLYSFYLHFCKDAFVRPYDKWGIKRTFTVHYDRIVSFIPPPVSGLLASDVRKINGLENIPLVQFWTDPLSLGRCDSIADIPRSRFMHLYLERKILSKADKVFFGYKLLCETEQKLHPRFAFKMGWTHISYVEHPLGTERVHNEKVTIGLFGAYQRRVRNIEPLLNAIVHFPDVQFIIRGDADFEIDASCYPNLDVEPGRKTADEIERLEAKCDILLSLAGLSGVTQPAGKTFYYANYDKPIVHIGDGANKEYFANYLKSFNNRWIICENDSNSIIQGIREAIETLPSFKLCIPDCVNPATIARGIVEY